MIELLSLATEASTPQNNDWVIIALTAIPVVGSGIVAYFANKKSASAQAQTKLLESRKIGREEFVTVTDNWKSLYESVLEENKHLRVRLEALEKKLAASAEEDL